MTATAAYRALFVAGLAAFFLSAAWGLVFAYLHEGTLPDVRESLASLDDHRALARLEPRSGATQAQLARALMRRGEYAQATAAFEQAVTWDPDDLESRVQLARLYLRDGQPARARSSVEAALERGAELDPELLQAVGLAPAGS